VGERGVTPIERIKFLNKLKCWVEGWNIRRFAKTHTVAIWIPREGPFWWI